ncbi:MAG TPA: hypothetical protein VIN59_05810 [Alphaproteobacteria bacterium]
MLVIEFNNKSKLYGSEEGAAARAALGLDQHDQSAEKIELAFQTAAQDIDQEFIEAFLLPTALKAARGEIPNPNGNMYGPYQISLPDNTPEDQLTVFRNRVMHRIEGVLTGHTYAINHKAADQSLMSKPRVGGIRRGL